MVNIKKHKKIYVGICTIAIIVCVIICMVADKNDAVEIENTAEYDIQISSDKIKNTEDEKEKFIYVHISGAVNLPGIYQLEQGARVNDALNISGGMTDEADVSSVNLAYQLSDGQKIKIPKKEEINITNENDIQNFVVQTDYQKNKEEKISINVATQSELESLCGIGPSLASRIIAYRKQNGRFEKIEEIKEVPGIGDSKYQLLKDDITL